MNQRINLRYPSRRLICILLFASVQMTLACAYIDHEQPIRVLVDMKRELRAGRFLPERSDRISIAGNFNKWQHDSLYLQHVSENIYEAMLPDKDLNDTLEFKLFQVAGDERAIANSGWEVVQNRRIVKRDVSNRQIRVRFNEPQDERERIDVTFSVGTKAARTLGIFRPEQGDMIIVSGSFCSWGGAGFLMEDEDNDGIYTITVAMQVALGQPIEYRFGILRKSMTNVSIPDAPPVQWAAGGTRKFIPFRDEKTVPYTEF